MLVLLEPRMHQGLACRNSLIVVAIQHLVEQILRLLRKTQQSRLIGNILIIYIPACFYLVPPSKRRNSG